MTKQGFVLVSTGMMLGVMRHLKFNASSLIMVKLVFIVCGKTLSLHFTGARRATLAMLGILLLVMPSCGENEEHVLQLRQLREKLAATEKKAAEVTSELEAARQAKPTKDESGEMAQKLAAAEARAAALESELQTMRKNASPTSSGGGPPNSVESFKLLLKQMQADLLKKTLGLAEAVVQEYDGKKEEAITIEETTVKRLEPPAEITSAFQSAVVFKIIDAKKQQRVLEFPVQAGLDGQWRIPSVADVRQHVSASIVGTTSVIKNDGHHETEVRRDTIVSGGSATPTVVIQWDKTTTPPPKVPAPPSSSAPSAAATSQRPAQSPAPTVPKPIMPVQQDVQIRFE